MSYEIVSTVIKDVFILKPKVYDDNRGWFFESYNHSDLVNKGLNYNFIQDNHSLSFKKGTIRGIHYQLEPYAQTKLVRCISGEIIDYAIDLRPKSKTYLKWVSVVLSSINKHQLLIPKGFAHAFYTVQDNTEVLYKVDQIYKQSHEKSIHYLDSKINIDWPSNITLTLSEKDLSAPFFQEKN